MKKFKASLKYQITRDGEVFNRVYNTFSEAADAGRELLNIGWIKSFEVRPVRAVWLRA